MNNDIFHILRTLVHAIHDGEHSTQWANGLLAQIEDIESRHRHSTCELKTTFQSESSTGT